MGVICQSEAYRDDCYRKHCQIIIMVKKISKILSLLVIIFPSVSLCEWTQIASTTQGDVYNIDFDRVTSDEDYVYYWRLSNYAKPTKYHDLSALVHVKVDCESNSTMDLQVTFYKQANAKGDGETLNRKPKWNSVHPNGVSEALFEAVCEFEQS